MNAEEKTGHKTKRHALYSMQEEEGDQMIREYLSQRRSEDVREPLSDDEISKLAWKQNIWTDGMIEFSFLAFAREIENAHGIGEQK